MACVDWPRWSLKGAGYKISPSQLPPTSHSSSSKKNPQKDKAKRPEPGGRSKGGGDRDKSPKKDRPTKDKWKGKKDEASKKYSCFLYSGPHRAFGFLKRGKLAALVQGEEEKQKEEKRITSLKLLNAIQAKVEGQPHGRMYVETIINRKPLQAMLDTGADTVYMAKELPDEVGLSYTKEKDFVKGLNARNLPIKGVARGAFIQIGQWQSKADIIVAPFG